MPSPFEHDLAGRARSVVSRLRRRVRVGGDPVVSVVVTAKASQVPFLGECLDSLRSQSWSRLHILVVPFGDDPDSVQKATRPIVHADRRVSLVQGLQFRTLGSARNVGVRRARGRFVVFVGASDVVPRSAVAQLVKSLRATGADFARGAVILDRGRLGDAAPGHAVEPQRGLSVSDAPRVMTDFFVEGTVFSRHFWEQHNLEFPDSDGTELDVTVARAYLEARSFNVLGEPTYRLMKRGTGNPVGSQSDAFEDLDSWLRTQDRIRVLLEGADEGVKLAWLTGVIGTSLRTLLENAERAEPEQWARVTATARGMLALGGRSLLAQVAVVPRLYVWLAAQDRRADLKDLVADRRIDRNDFPTVVEHGVVLARVLLFGDADRPVPDDLFALSDWETPLVTSLRSLRWVEENVLELDLHAFIRYLPMEHQYPTAEARLVDPVSGRQIHLPVRQRRDPGATRFGAMRWHNYDCGAMSVLVDTAELVSSSGVRGPVNWQLEIDLVASGVARRSPVTHRLQAGAAGAPTSRLISGRIVSLPGGSVPVTLSVTVPAARLVKASVEGRVVSGELIIGDGVMATRLVATRGRFKASASLFEAGDVHLFRLELPTCPDVPVEPADRHWTLRLASEAGENPVAWPEGLDEGYLGAGPTTELALCRTKNGNSAVIEVRGLAQVDEVLLSEESLTVRGSWLGAPLDMGAIALQGPRVQLRGEMTPGDADGRFEAVVPLVLDEWGTGTAFVPVGTYRIVLSAGGASADPDVRPLMIGQPLESTLPIYQRAEAFRMRLHRGAAGRPCIRLAKPYRDEEVGAFAQQRLRAAYQCSTVPIDDHAVYLQSYAGNTATDSPLALHHQLRRTHPHLTLYWGVADRATVLPEGAVPLLTYTREWYEALARVKYLVNNVDFDRWFARKPGQRMLQTFHGYPAKSMGLGMWRAKKFTPRSIEAELDRTSRHWDMILTPAPEMDKYYRSEYNYDGPIVSHGYPRDDALVGDGADAVRIRTRKSLGIQNHQTVVLYAPTWRDDLATTYRSSTLVRHLDLEKSSEALGENYVLLMRGHRFHAGQQRASTNARLIDVTHYPEINDLILASDAAVLDYSSLRFDFALTERPMLFLVPDLDNYAGGARGFLYPFEDSAPGPLLTHADEVVDLLRDLGRVRETHREQYVHFNCTYNYLQDGRSAEHVVAAFFAAGDSAE